MPPLCLIKTWNKHRHHASAASGSAFACHALTSSLKTPPAYARAQGKPRLNYKHARRQGFYYLIQLGFLFQREHAERVLELPIRDCARGCNNCVHTRAQMSAIDVTENILFERLYLVSGMGTFGPRVNCPYAPTTLTIHSTTISGFLCNFFRRMAHHLFGHHDWPRIWRVPVPSTLRGWKQTNF